MMRVAQGDAAAFRVLYERYYRPLLAYLDRRTADRAAAEDLLQEVFLRVFLAATRFDPDRPFAAWLYAVAANLSCDAHRRRAARPAEVPLAGALEETIMDEKVDPSVVLMRQLEAELVREAVATLPLAHRDVVIEHIYKDLPFREIAAEMGIAEGTARWRMHDALKRLRRTLLKSVRERG
jgi:RNA polymerase sigma-70 factor (ECF subfamily)